MVCPDGAARRGPKAEIPRKPDPEPPWLPWLLLLRGTLLACKASGPDPERKARGVPA